MTDKPHTPTTLEIRKEFINLDGTFANGSWDVGSLKRFDRWYQDEIAAAEQRGAVRALREAAKDWRWSAWTDAPRNPIATANYTGDWIENRADRIADKEGDDE